MPSRVSEKYADNFKLGTMRLSIFSEGETLILTVQAMLNSFPRTCATILFCLDLQTLSYDLARPPLESEIPRYAERPNPYERFQMILRKEGDNWLIIVSKYSEISLELVECARDSICSKVYDKFERPFAVVTTSRIWILSTACLEHSLANFKRLYYSNIGERRVRPVDCPLPPALGDLEAWATGGTQVQETSRRLTLQLASIVWRKRSAGPAFEF